MRRAKRRTDPRQRLAFHTLMIVVVVVFVAACGGAAATSTPTVAPTATIAPAAPATTAPATSAPATSAPATSTTAPQATATGATAAQATVTRAATGSAGTPALSQPGALLPCSAAASFRQLQPPTPATPRAGASPMIPPTAAAPPPPTSTPRPAPQRDNVGFPEGYQDAFKLLFVFDRPDNRQVRVICGNDLAASIRPGQPFPYGSVLVMETYRTKLDASGTPLKDANGNFIREALVGIFVQRKEPGFGTEYGADRSGEWEYVGFRPDKSYSNPPATTNACAACHLNQAGPSVDFAFRMELFLNPGSIVPPKPVESEVNIHIYAFVPGNLTVKPGTTVTWINQDEAEHSINAVDKSFDSPTLKTKNVKPGERFSYTFTAPGTYEYFCAIHPLMKARIEVR